MQMYKLQDVLIFNILCCKFVSLALHLARCLSSWKLRLHQGDPPSGALRSLALRQKYRSPVSKSLWWHVPVVAEACPDGHRHLDILPQEFLSPI